MRVSAVTKAMRRPSGDQAGWVDHDPNPLDPNG